jgi:DNA-binding CsgD family transcriptional regulator
MELRMTMSRVSELVTFLSNKNHSLSEILIHLVRVTFRDLRCEWISLSEITDRNEFVTVEISGASESSSNELSDRYSLSDHYPVSVAIKSGTIVFIPSLEDSVQEYPLLTKYPALLDNNSFFAVPISLSATPVAAFVITCKRDSALHNVDLDFLTAVADIFALSVYTSRDFNSFARKVELDIPHLDPNDSEGLTPRQVLISRLISEGRTNHDISELIGFSESTVRQEIMKLFLLTNSKSRHEVGEHYQRRHKES